MSDWRANLIEDEDGIRELARSSKRIAVLGIKPESRSSEAAFYVARYLADAGLEVFPVPVYYPEVTHILGRPVVRRVCDVPAPIDLVNVFRRSEDVLPHVPDLIAARPRAVWLQLGIRNEEAAEQLARAGIAVVQDRCLMVDHRRASAR